MRMLAGSVRQSLAVTSGSLPCLIEEAELAGDRRGRRRVRAIGNRKAVKSSVDIADDGNG